MQPERVNTRPAPMPSSGYARAQQPQPRSLRTVDGRKRIARIGVSTVVKFSFRALLVFLLFVAGFALALRVPAQADPIARALIWGWVAAMSVVAVVLTVRRGGARGQDAAVPDRLRRWMLGEPSDQPADRKRQ